jgi:hypothetical protein
MTLKNDTELANTRAKLKKLEEMYESVRDDADEDPHVRELTMSSIKSTIKQFKEEIARYQAHQTAR